MGQAEITIFIVLATVGLLLFISGILLFIIQYRRRKILHNNEKTMIHETHQREILTTQLQIQEQTMQDIGREIHDNVGQRLTLASIYANQILAGNTVQDERLASIGSIIKDALAELRSLSKSLISTDADADELRTILEQECARVEALGVCSISCRFTEARFSISAIVRNFIVRIVQEALQNSLKHASCSHISLQLDFGSDGLTLILADDGSGFDLTAGYNGIGLENMRRRAGLIGAGYHLESLAGQGTTVHLFIPTDKLSTI